jgi:hypothetical protein
MNNCTEQTRKSKDAQIAYEMTFSVAIYNFVLKSYLLVTSDFNYDSKGGFKNGINFESWNTSKNGTSDKN